MAIVAVSAHLDDAALSASASLRGVGATVLTVFTAMPPPALKVSLWDQLTGASSSAQRQAERLAEDAAVMTLLAAGGDYLDEPEAQFRSPDSTSERIVERVAGCIAERLTGSDELWLPAAIGRHPDHVLARDAGLRAAGAAGRGEIVLYADFPYVTLYGWPAWVSGHPVDLYLDPDVWLADQLRAVGLEGRVRSAEVIKLTEPQRAAKAAIIGTYRTQASALGLTAAALAREPAKLDYELHWCVPREVFSRSSAGALR